MVWASQRKLDKEGKTVGQKERRMRGGEEEGGGVQEGGGEKAAAGKVTGGEAQAANPPYLL